VSCAAGGGCRDDVSFFCPVRMRDSEQLPVAVVGQSGVCSVRTSSTTHDPVHGWQCVGEQRRAEVDEADTHSQGHRRHTTRTTTRQKRRIMARDGRTTRVLGRRQWEHGLKRAGRRHQVRAAALGGNRRRRGCKGSDEQRRGHGRAVSCCVACCVEYSGSYCLALLRCHWYTVIINRPFHLISSLTLTCSRACLDLHSCLPSEHLTSGVM
jgi:hypothetical protein